MNCNSEFDWLHFHFFFLSFFWGTNEDEVDKKLKLVSILLQFV